MGITMSHEDQEKLNKFMIERSIDNLCYKKRERVNREFMIGHTISMKLNF